MSVRMFAELSCDDCDTTYPAPVTACSSAETIRAASWGDGWVTYQSGGRRRFDLCSDCRAARKGHTS